MKAYSNDKRLGDVEHALWRPVDEFTKANYPQSAVVGTLVLNDIETHPITDIVLYSEQNGRMGKTILHTVQVIGSTIEGNYASLQFVAENVTEWKPLNI
jgi:hypothetical protein